CVVLRRRRPYSSPFPYTTLFRSVLMLDEPVNGLDPEGVLWIRTLLKSLAAEGRAVFLSSHLMSEMSMTADRLIIIGRGRLIAQTDRKSTRLNSSHQIISYAVFCL